MPKFETEVNHSQGVFVGDTVNVGDIHFHGPTPGQEAMRQLEVGVEYLERKRYAEASQNLEAAVRLLPTTAVVEYFRAVVTLAGRRPRRLTYQEVTRIEGYLDAALQLERQPHYGLLWAFVKYDFYAFNGMREGDPTSRALLQGALDERPDPVAVRWLLKHLPEARNNPAMQAIVDLA